MVWPWLERFGFINDFRNFRLDTTISANLAAYMERMKNVKNWWIKMKIINAIFDAMLSSGQVDYDIGLKQL